MKKILSLLALLVTTVAAMAASYTDVLTFKVRTTTGTNTAQELVITANGDDTYNLVLSDMNTSEALAMNLGQFTFSNVAGTTADGVTTISVSSTPTTANTTDIPSCSAGTLDVKFNDNKAYLHYVGNVNYMGFMPFSAELTFGTDEGFTTGGGTVTPDPTVPVDLVEPDFNPAGQAFLYSAPINWDAQKLVAKIDLTTCKNEAAPNEQVFTCGTADLSWDVDVFTFYRKSDKTLQSYTNNGGVNTGAQTVDVTQPIYVELSKANGFSINGTIDQIDPSRLNQLFSLSTIYVGSTGSTQASNATYKYIKVVPLDWTEPTEPEPFEPIEADYHYNAYVEYNGVYTDIEGGADVTVTEYEKDKYSATFKGVTDGANTLGDLTFNNLTATTSDEGTRYSTTDETTATWTNVTEGGEVSGITENATATFSDFFCALGELADNDYNFALSFKVNVAGSDINVVFGKSAPKATTYTGKWNVVRKGETTMDTVEEATVSILLKDESHALVTIPAFSDHDVDYPGIVDPMTFEVNYMDALVDGVQSVKFVCNDADVEMTGDWEYYHASVSMNGDLVDGKLTAQFTAVLGGMPDYTYNLGFNYEPFVPSADTFTAAATVTFGEQTAKFDAATVVVKEYEEGKYSLTYNSLTLNGNEIGDFTISDITAAKDETTGVTTLTTTATKGEWTRVMQDNAAGIDAGDEADIRNFEATATPGETDEDATTFVAKFGVNVQGEWADVVFGVKEESSEIVLAEDYQADGTGFEKPATIDWETQKVVISLNTESCQRSIEHLFGVGVDGTSWGKNVHLYYSSSDSKLQGYWDQGSGTNNNTGKFDCTGIVKAEISKANGFVVDGVTKISASNMDVLFDMSNIVVGSGENSNQESYAYYNYIKIVPLDWTEPTQPVTKTYDAELLVEDGLTEETVFEQTEAQTVVTINTDNTASFTLKNVTLGTVSGDLTFTGAYVEEEDGGDTIFMLQGASDEATTALFGSEMTMVISGICVDENTIKFTFEMFDADQTVYYVGAFDQGIITAINNVNVDAVAGNAQIFTISGAKVNSLQKGVNIVRTADGKTVKVLRK